MKVICLLTLYLISITLRANYYIPKRPIPFELESILDSINYDLTSENDKKHTKIEIAKLDFLLNNYLTKEVFFIIKSTLYKKIFLELPVQKASKKFYRNILKLKSSSFPKNNMNFATWLKISLKEDLIKVTNSPIYKTYLSYKEGNNVKYTSPLRRIHKKISLLSPWYLLLNKNSQVENDYLLQPYYKKWITEINSTISEFIYLSKGSPVQLPAKIKLSFFRIDKTLKKRPMPEFNILKTLDSVIEKHTKDKLPLPVKDWIPREDDFNNPIDDFEIPKADSTYRAPRNLPPPVDEWRSER
jgi:hypothetical protein